MEKKSWLISINIDLYLMKYSVVLYPCRGKDHSGYFANGWLNHQLDLKNYVTLSSKIQHVLIHRDQFRHSLEVVVLTEVAGMT